MDRRVLAGAWNHDGPPGVMLNVQPSATRPPGRRPSREAKEPLFYPLNRGRWAGNVARGRPTSGPNSSMTLGSGRGRV